MGIFTANLNWSSQGAASSQQQLFLAWMQSMGRRQVGFGFFRVIQRERKDVHMGVSWNGVENPQNGWWK